MTRISAVLPVRNAESAVAKLVETVFGALDYIHPIKGREPLDLAEVIALDERSDDNTLSALTILHGRFPQLRTIQDIEPGTAIRVGAKVARGELWLALDHPIDPDRAAWAIDNVLRGYRAAIIVGEVLAVQAEIGRLVLPHCPGGLVSAQAAITRELQRSDHQAAWAPPQTGSARDRLRLVMRSRLGRLGFGRFDRPARRK
jgi:glycosyltransferase involved in cell wall biosynthesis